MLGIVTEVTVRLLPIPATKRLVLVAFATLEAAAGAVGKIIANGIVPAGLEMMDAARDCRRRGVRPRRLSDRRRRDPAVRTRRHPRRSRRTVRAGAAADAFARAQPKYARRATTRTGSGCGSAAKPRSPPSAGSRRTITAWTARFRARGWARYCAPSKNCQSGSGLLVANVFHAGDGNLHPLILYDANAPGELAKAEEMGGEILALCVAVGRDRHR